MNIKRRTNQFASIVSLIFLFFVFLTQDVSAKTYYVSQTGSDSNDGGQSSPYATISKGISSATSGDTVYVYQGTYQPFNISKSGANSSPISILGNGSVVSGGQNAIAISGSYINISGFNVKDSVSHGIVISGKNINVSDFEVYDTVNENKSGSSCSGSGGWGSGFKIMVGGENINVDNVKIYHNCGEGFAVTRGVSVNVSRIVSYDNFSANIYIDNSRNVLLEKSFTYCTNDQNYYRSGQPATGILIGEEIYSGWGAQLENVRIINNISYKCKGINFYGAQVTDGGLNGGLIAHNTIWDVFNGGKAINIADEPNNSNIQIKNNIAAGQISSGAGVDVSNNISTTTFQTTPSYNSSSFYLTSTSSAKDAGTVINGITDDFSGALRDSKPDLGAFEFGSNVSPTTPPQPTSLPTTPPTTPPTKMGDVNKDGRVDIVDIGIVIDFYGQDSNSSNSNADVNKDGIINIVDIGIIIDNYGL